MPERRFPPPCSVDEVDSKLDRRSFIVRDVVGRRSLTSISRRSRDGAHQGRSPAHRRQRRQAIVSRGPFNFWKTTPYKVPSSYFCTCWNETPTASASMSWVTPASRRRNLSREATWRSMALGRRFDICSTALPGRTQHVACAPVGSVSASSR